MYHIHNENWQAKEIIIKKDPASQTTSRFFHIKDRKEREREKTKITVLRADYRKRKSIDEIGDNVEKFDYEMQFFNKYREGETFFFFWKRYHSVQNCALYNVQRDFWQKPQRLCLPFLFPFVNFWFWFRKVDNLLLFLSSDGLVWLVGNVTRWWISFWEGEFEEELRLEETQVGISFHHVLDAPLGSVENVLVRIIRLDVCQCQEPCLRIQVDLEISKKSGNFSYQMR